jgi:hypothetical protein
VTPTSSAMCFMVTTLSGAGAAFGGRSLDRSGFFTKEGYLADLIAQAKTGSTGFPLRPRLFATRFLGYSGHKKTRISLND